MENRKICRGCKANFDNFEMSSSSSQSSLQDLNFILHGHIPFESNSNINITWICQNCSRQIAFVVDFMRQAIRVHRELCEISQDIKTEPITDSLQLLSDTSLHDASTTEDGTILSFNEADFSTGNLPLSCDMCQRTFLTEDEYEKHMAFHVQKPFGCRICGKSFSKKAFLMNHCKTHPELVEAQKTHMESAEMGNFQEDEGLFMQGDAESFPCDQCSKIFKTKNGLKAHKVCHDNTFPFVCSVCQKAFRRVYELELHSRVHSGLRPYVCNTCNSTYTRKSHLKAHMETHEGVTFPCNLCGKLFSAKSSLKYHQKTIHRRDYRMESFQNDANGSGKDEELVSLIKVENETL